MLIIAIIVLSLHRCMPLFYSFNIRLMYDRTSFIAPLMALSPTASVVSKHLVLFHKTLIVIHTPFV